MSIRKLREERGLTQKSVASALGVSAQTIGNWENDPRKMSLGSAVRLADYLGVSIDALVEHKPKQIFFRKDSHEYEQLLRHKEEIDEILAHVNALLEDYQ